MKWDLDIFAGKDVVFVGRGKGRAYDGFLSFMQKNGQARSIAAVDKKEGDNPLGFLEGYDSTQTVFVKNEAIPGSEMPVSYTTPMQLFFKLVSQVGSQTIGI